MGNDGQGNQIAVNGFELNSADPVNGNEFHFTKEKPYVIYGFAGIPAGKELVIDPGARVYFHAESGIIVKPGGTLTINGGDPPNDPTHPLQNEVVFEGDRLEPSFSDTPGQWFAVWLLDDSVGNINHLTVKNATVGLLIDKATATITNSQIYNSANVGILGRNSTMVTASNVVVNYAGQACVASISGGSYDFRHCTFNNNWNNPDQVAVSMSNYITNANNQHEVSPLSLANFYNCIIYGTNRIELFLDRDSTAVYKTDFKNCLIKFNDEGTAIANADWYNQVRHPDTINQNKLNQDPQFLNANANQLNIFDTSPADGIGNPAFSTPLDILGFTRSPLPDAGAYESVPH